MVNDWSAWINGREQDRGVMFWSGLFFSALCFMFAILVLKFGGGRTSLVFLIAGLAFFIPLVIQPYGFRWAFGPQHRMSPIWDDFKLRKGMTGKQIFNEMHLHTSGEAQQEVAEFLHDDVNSVKVSGPLAEAQKALAVELRKEPWEVLDVQEIEGRMYALVKKNRLNKIDDNRRTRQSLSYTATYALAGINDEGFYFVHPLETFVGDASKESLRNIVDWVNRKYDGFYGRLQGDILYKMIPLEKDSATYYTYNVSRFSSPHLIQKEEFDKIQNPDSDSIELSLEDLGRHRLAARGVIATHQVDPTVSFRTNYWSVIANKVVIHHPEHQKTELEIPKNHVLVLAVQDGRRMVEEQVRSD